MALMNVAKASLKADALLVFSWVGPDTAVVREASESTWHRAVLTLPYAQMKHAHGALLELVSPRDLVSTALASALDFVPGAALAVNTIGEGGAPLGGMLALWESVSRVPDRVQREPRRSTSELARMADEWLRQSDRNDRAELFEQVLRRTPDAIVFLPDDGHRALVNDAAAALFALPVGSAPSAEVALRLRDFGQRVVNGAERDAMAATIFGRRVDVHDSLWELASEETDFYRVSCFSANHGAQRGRVWTFRDVSPEQRLVRQLSERKALMRSQHQFLAGVLEAIDDAVIASDAQGNLVLLNSAARRHHGMHDHELIAGTVDRLASRLVDSKTLLPLELAEAPARRALAGEEVSHEALAAVHGENRRDLVVSAHALRGPLGDVSGAVIIERDVTERNATEAQLRQSEKLQALGRMAAAITHDVNNLLTVMQSSISVLEHGGAHSPTFHDDIATLSTAVEESRTLTRHLLDFCRGRVRAPQPVDLVSLMERLRGLLGRMAAPDVETRVVVPTSDALVVLGDAAELEQVIFNLCVNANDAMPLGGKVVVELGNANVSEPRLHAKGVLPAGAWVWLRVSDTGEGMSEEVLARAFEPFFTTKGHGAGTGLGLSTVYGIVERYGGHLDVQSEEGAGTTVTAYFPAYVSSVERRRRLTPPQAVAVMNSSEHSAHSPARVLLVEDDAMVRRAVSRMLRQSKFEVTEAASGVEALTQLDTQQFDVLLSDVQMAEMDGASLVRALRLRGVCVPVILMSGFADLADAELLALEGVSAFLTKPFSPEEVIRSIAGAVRRVAPARV